VGEKGGGEIPLHQRREKGIGEEGSRESRSSQLAKEREKKKRRKGRLIGGGEIAKKGKGVRPFYLKKEGADKSTVTRGDREDLAHCQVI